MEAKRPLPGRAVIITFDDGYRDFLTEAWPLLAQYGFSATVFLVAGKVGRTNEWDHHYGQEIPLLGWEEIRGLQKEGIEFGSHSMSHRPLTKLSVEETVREAAPFQNNARAESGHAHPGLRVSVWREQRRDSSFGRSLRLHLRPDVPFRAEPVP